MLKIAFSAQNLFFLILIDSCNTAMNVFKFLTLLYWQILCWKRMGLLSCKLLATTDQNVQRNNIMSQHSIYFKLN